MEIPFNPSFIEPPSSAWVSDSSFSSFDTDNEGPEYSVPPREGDARGCCSSSSLITSRLPGSILAVPGLCAWHRDSVYSLALVLLSAGLCLAVRDGTCPVGQPHFTTWQTIPGTILLHQLLSQCPQICPRAGWQL